MAEQKTFLQQKPRDFIRKMKRASFKLIYTKPQQITYIH